MALGRSFKKARAALAAALVFAFAAAAPPALAEDADATPGHITLVAFGDSLIHGYGLPVEEGFVPQLQAWLEAEGAGPVTVVNAGVSGDTTSGGLSRLDWSVGPEADAVLLELGANDALRGVDPAIVRNNLDAMLGRFAERGLPVLLAGMYAPRNWGAEYVDQFEAIYPDLATKHDVPLYPFFLAGLVDETEQSGRSGRSEYIQNDGLHPNKDGVARVVEAIGPEIVALIETTRARKAGQGS